MDVCPEEFIPEIICGSGNVPVPFPVEPELDVPEVEPAPESEPESDWSLFDG